MGYLSPLFMLTIAYVLGSLLKVIFRDDDDRVTETCLIGTFFVLIVWQIILLICDKAGLEFGIAFKMMVATMLVMFSVSLVLCRNKFKNKLMITNRLSVVPVILIGFILVIEIFCFFIFFPDRVGDYSVEIVNTVMVTDSIYGFDPLTGAQRIVDIPILEKLNILPYMYTFLCKLFGTGSFIMVYRCVPMWVLALNFMVYGMWADTFFDKTEKKGYEIAIFLVGVGALNLCGTFSKDSIFYYLTLKGFTGDSFCYSVLIPFVLYEFFDVFKRKNYKKIIYIILAGISVLLVADIHKGMVSFMIASAMCMIIALGYKIRRYIKWS